MKKTPTAHTDEELLKLLNEDTKDLPTEIPPHHDNEILSFLSTFKIEDGKTPISKRLLLELYRSWTKEPLTNTQFYYGVSKYLMTLLSSGQSFYLINQKALTLTETAYKLLNKRVRDKTKNNNWRSHFENYLAKYKIKPGNYYVEAFVLYNLYDKYAYEIGKKLPLSEFQFHRFCSLYFTKKKLTEDRVSWFGVHKSIKNVITDDDINTLRESRTKRGKKTKSKG